MHLQRKKIGVVFGTRPEAIKLCPLIIVFRKEPDIIVEVCNTGQHRKMTDDVLDAFGIKPEVDLNLMETDQSLAHFTANAVSGIDEYIRNNSPSLIIVQGDTTSAFCGALAAFYNKIPIAHIEAGLRTFDKFSPFPEEINRTLISRIADYHFAPTESARRNLVADGIPSEKIFVTGNTVVDALNYASEKINTLHTEIQSLLSKRIDLQSGSPILLITCHRRESFGERLENICRAILKIAIKFPETQIVFPVHFNPHVRNVVFSILNGKDNIRLIEPLPYLLFIALMMRSTLILTDSGGIQEEAPTLGIPVVVMRDHTERTETIETGTSVLVKPESDKIIDTVSRLLTDKKVFSSMRNKTNPYGDGKACERIVRRLADG